MHMFTHMLSNVQPSDIDTHTHTHTYVCIPTYACHIQELKKKLENSENEMNALRNLVESLQNQVSASMYACCEVCMYVCMYV
jgi:hypothetical protein